MLEKANFTFLLAIGLLLVSPSLEYMTPFDFTTMVTCKQGMFFNYMQNVCMDCNSDCGGSCYGVSFNCTSTCSDHYYAFETTIEYMYSDSSSIINPKKAHTYAHKVYGESLFEPLVEADLSIEGATKSYTGYKFMPRPKTDWMDGYYDIHVFGAKPYLRRCISADSCRSIENHLPIGSHSTNDAECIKQNCDIDHCRVCDFEVAEIECKICHAGFKLSDGRCDVYDKFTTFSDYFFWFTTETTSPFYVRCPEGMFNAVDTETQAGDVDSSYDLSICQSCSTMWDNEAQALIDSHCLECLPPYLNSTGTRYKTIDCRVCEEGYYLRSFSDETDLVLRRPLRKPRRMVCIPESECADSDNIGKCSFGHHDYNMKSHKMHCSQACKGKKCTGPTAYDCIECNEKKGYYLSQDGQYCTRKPCGLGQIPKASDDSDGGYTCIDCSDMGDIYGTDLTHCVSCEFLGSEIADGEPFCEMCEYLDIQKAFTGSIYECPTSLSSICADGEYGIATSVNQNFKKVTCQDCPSSCVTCEKNSIQQRFCECVYWFSYTDSLTMNPIDDGFDCLTIDDIPCSSTEFATLIWDEFLGEPHFSDFIDKVNSIVTGAGPGPKRYKFSDNGKIISFGVEWEVLGCSDCSGLCLECYGTDTNCTACATGKFRVPNGDGTHYCASSQPTSTFYDSDSSSYLPCMANCEKCEDAVTCNRCVDFYYKDNLTDPTNHRCLSSCPSYLTKAFMSDNQVTGLCLCPEECESCPNFEYCTICSASYPYFIISPMDPSQRSCYQECPLAFYSTSDSECLPCGDDCKYCSDDGSTCLECYKGFYMLEQTSSSSDSGSLDSGNTVCVEECPSYLAADSKTQECVEDCIEEKDYRCDLCSAVGGCSKCSYGFFLFGKTCVSGCPGIYKGQKTKGSCDCGACISCKKSSGKWGVECSSQACSSGYEYNADLKNCLPIDSETPSVFFEVDEDLVSYNGFIKRAQTGLTIKLLLYQGTSEQASSNIDCSLESSEADSEVFTLVKTLSPISKTLTIELGDSSFSSVSGRGNGILYRVKVTYLDVDFYYYFSEGYFYSGTVSSSVSGSIEQFSSTPVVFQISGIQTEFPKATLKLKNSATGEVLASKTVDDVTNDVTIEYTPLLYGQITPIITVSNEYAYKEFTAPTFTVSQQTSAAILFDNIGTSKDVSQTLQIISYALDLDGSTVKSLVGMSSFISGSGNSLQYLLDPDYESSSCTLDCGDDGTCVYEGSRQQCSCSSLGGVLCSVSLNAYPIQTMQEMITNSLEVISPVDSPEIFLKQIVQMTNLAMYFYPQLSPSEPIAKFNDFVNEDVFNFDIFPEVLETAFALESINFETSGSNSGLSVRIAEWGLGKIIEEMGCPGTSSFTVSTDAGDLIVYSLTEDEIPSPLSFSVVSNGKTWTYSLVSSQASNIKSYISSKGYEKIGLGIMGTGYNMVRGNSNSVLPVSGGLSISFFTCDGENISEELVDYLNIYSSSSSLFELCMPKLSFLSYDATDDTSNSTTSTSIDFNCAYLDDDTSAYSVSGMDYEESSSSSICCSTNHLTFFSYTQVEQAVLDTGTTTTSNTTTTTSFSLLLSAGLGVIWIMALLNI